MTDRFKDSISDGIHSCLSLIRLLIFNKPFHKTRPVKRRNNQCIILGNGPSLSSSLQVNAENLNEFDLIAVNFMGSTHVYEAYKPSVYILCDPAFWSETANESLRKKVSDLIERIQRVTTWSIELYFPLQARKNHELIKKLQINPHIQTRYFNTTPVEGWRWFCNRIYNKQWGMPRPRNVIIAALMLAIYSQYQKIFLFGAENDWLRTLRIDNDNLLTNEFRHFYTQTPAATSTPSRKIKKNEYLHEVLSSLYIVFRNYVIIEQYAHKKGIKIYNCTPESYIDAFERKEKPE